MPARPPQSLDEKYAALEERVRRLERRGSGAIRAQGLFAERPPSDGSNNGTTYYATDMTALYYSNGVAWLLLT